MSVVIHNGVLEERRTYPLAWGYVACVGGIRAMTRHELGLLSTKMRRLIEESLTYPQPAGEIHGDPQTPPVSGAQPVDKT